MSLVGPDRSTAYYQPRTTSDDDLALIRLIDEIHLKPPFLGSRRIPGQVRDRGRIVYRKRVQRLMSLMSIRALYPTPRTSARGPGTGHVIYPYRLKDLIIERSNQVWGAGVWHLPIAKGFMYLVAFMNWHTRKVLSWRLSNTMDTAFCVDALEEALRRFGKPEIFNTDQGSQFNSEAITGVLKAHEITISINEKGRWVDNVLVERLWRSVTYEDVYLKAYETPNDLQCGLEKYFRHYNTQRRHTALDRRALDAVYFGENELPQPA